MTVATSDDPRLAILKNRHGLNQEEASHLLKTLQASLSLDIVNGDTDEPLVDFDDDLSDLVDRSADSPPHGDRTGIPAD
jgi:hypothetical protein